MSSTSDPRLPVAPGRRRAPPSVRAACRLFGALLLAAASSALAWPLSAAEDEAYRIGMGDTLRVSVFGEARLTGEFKVAPDGTIGYPLLGNVPVIGQTPAETGQQLGGRIAELLPLPSEPTVEVVEYAPVFVVGDVVSPGPYEFRPGIIAMELVAIAGGMMRSATVESQVTQLIASEREVADLRIAQFSAQAQRQRLLAEIAGTSMNVSELADSLVPAAVQERILANETALFEVRRDVLDGQRKMLNAQRASFDEEIASLTKSIALHEDELKLLQQEVDTQQGLFERGLTVKSRVSATQRELSQTRRDDLELRSFLARAHQRQLEVDQRQQELFDVRARENAELLKETDVQLARIEEQLIAAAATADALRARMSAAAGRVPQPPALSVIRAGPDGRTTYPVDELATLQPRDILRVVVEAPGATRRTTGLGARAGAATARTE